MKNILNKTGWILGLGLITASCSDFEELNIDPRAANIEQVQVEYFINNSIVSAQQDPHIAERAFVLYWKAAGRQDRTNTLPVGGYDDGWSSDYFRYVSGWLNNANTAIQVAEEKVALGSADPDTHNLLQVARIWRAYLMSEMADNFGPIPISGFQGTNPEFVSLQDVYYFLLEELKDAASQIDPAFNSSDIANLDPAYGYNYENWIRYANSMRMRLAMRLSEVDPGKAQSEFEAAASQPFIETFDQAFKVAEKPGWDALTGVMTREWNSQYLSATMNNLYVGLGGISTAEQLGASFEPYVKPENYMGLKYEDHFTTLTNDPSAGFWFDGLHAEIDPRAYEAFAIPGDFSDPDFSFYPSWTSDASNTVRNLINENAEVVETIDAAFTWNASAVGSWGEKGSKNQVYAYVGTIPRMSQEFRTSTSERVFFGPWESYFLIAEAALRGWSTPIEAQAAYEQGVRSSFDYWNLGGYVDRYLASEDYNRVGTSVAWNHTAEPPASVNKQFVNGYTGQTGTFEYQYPDNMLYLDGTVKNDQLTKIITQKFIAQFPWLPLETWNDHRRLGLPFFETPAIENPLPDMPAISTGNFREMQVNFYPQRLKYPSNLRNSAPEGYQQAVNFLEGPDDVFTPLWWAQH